MILAEAFMKRNDLKKQIINLTSSTYQNLWQEVGLPINFGKGTKVDPKIAYIEVMKLMDELKTLNVAISKANTVNVDILREIETIIAKIALIEGILNAAKMYPGDKIRERNYGEVTNSVIENEWLIDPQSLQVELQNLQNKKRDLEKFLSHNNFVTEVLI
jgi:hypothetical protein